MKIVDSPQANDKPLFATIGMFDGVHCGHLALIRSVRSEAEQAGALSAVVTFKTHPREVLRPESRLHLLTTFDERMERLSEAGIDRAIVLDFTEETARLTAREFIAFLAERYGVRGLVVGYDHRFGHNRREGFADYCRYAREFDMEMKQALPYRLGSETVSSSAIRQALAAGEIDRANKMLGYAYRLTGRVIDGHRLGRTLGFPTANLLPDDNRKLLPARGVYAVRATLPDGQELEGMMNIGERPTVAGDNDLTVETHLFDFAGDLYGKHLSIALTHYMRKEQKYDSLDDLRRHLQQDAETARRLLQTQE